MTRSRARRPTGRSTPSSLRATARCSRASCRPAIARSEEHTSELQSRLHLVCRLLLEKKKVVRPGRGGAVATGSPAHPTGRGGEVMPATSFDAIRAAVDGAGLAYRHASEEPTDTSEHS